MNDDWFDYDDDDEEFDLGIEIIAIAYSSPEVFSRPNDPAVKRINEHVTARQDALEEAKVYFRQCSGGPEYPAQHPLEPGVLTDIAGRALADHLQLSLFSDHPEVVVTQPPEQIHVAVLDLLGAVIIQESDIREQAVVADVIGLLRREGAAVDHIVHLVMAAFDAILDVSVHRGVPLRVAHAAYLAVATTR